jgi:hypothetical protein
VSGEKLHTYQGVLHDPADGLPRDCLIEWLRFEVESETFDRNLPGFWLRWGKDEWMPHDRALSMRFAREKKLDAENKLRSVGHHPDNWREARRYAASLSYDRQRELLMHLTGKELPPKPEPGEGWLRR